MNEKNRWAFIAVVLIAFIAVGAISYFIGRADQRIDGRAGQQLETARELNREITDEQRRTLERTTRSINSLERIRGITEETDSTLRELRLVIGRSSDLLRQIETQLDILENYLRGVSDIIGDYDNHHGSD